MEAQDLLVGHVDHEDSGAVRRQELARLLGGDIGVSSRVDEGSTFTISVPFDSRQCRQDQPVAKDLTTG